MEDQYPGPTKGAPASAGRKTPSAFVCHSLPDCRHVSIEFIATVRDRWDGQILGQRFKPLARPIQGSKRIYGPPPARAGSRAHLRVFKYRLCPRLPLHASSPSLLPTYLLCPRGRRYYPLCPPPSAEPLFLPPFLFLASSAARP